MTEEEFTEIKLTLREIQEPPYGVSTRWRGYLSDVIKLVDHIDLLEKILHDIMQDQGYHLGVEQERGRVLELLKKRQDECDLFSCSRRSAFTELDDLKDDILKGES